MLGAAQASSLLIPMTTKSGLGQRGAEGCFGEAAWRALGCVPGLEWPELGLFCPPLALGPQPQLKRQAGALMSYVQPQRLILCLALML